MQQFQLRERSARWHCLTRSAGVIGLLCTALLSSSCVSPARVTPPLGDLSGLRGSDFEFFDKGAEIPISGGGVWTAPEDGILMTTNYYMRVGARIIDELPAR